MDSFGPDAVFRDTNAIQPGTRWWDVIERSVRRCDVFILVIGPDWLTAQDDEGRRIDDSDDVHHREIALALALNKPMIIVLVEDAGVPDVGTLPAELRTLLQWQAITLSDRHWSSDYRALEASLRAMTGVDDVAVRLLFPGASVLDAPLKVSFDGREVGSGSWRRGFDISARSTIGTHRITIEQGGALKLLMKFSATTIDVTFEKGGAYVAAFKRDALKGGFQVNVQRQDSSDPS